jgi:fatty-acyl-CoA synthase
MNIPLTPIRCLYRGIDLYGKKIGIVCGDKQFTYAQFGERCERLAAGLIAHGVKPGDRVAYLSFNTHQLLEGYFGPMLAGAITMPLNVRLTPEELTSILNHSGARMLIYEDDFEPLIQIFRQFCPDIAHYVSTGLNSKHADLAYEKLLTRDPLPRPDIFSVDENSIAELFYTSGSTGTPKGVALSHRTLYLHALGALLSVRNSDTSVDLHTIPLFHANGWGKPQTSTMIGTRQVMVRRFDPPKVLELIERERATQMMLVPVMANALLNCAELGRFDTSSLLEIMLGGAASSSDLVLRLENAFKCRILTGYGLTETSPVVTSSRNKATVHFADDSERITTSAMAGWPIVGNEVQVVDVKGNPVPRDMQTVGEVIVRGDNVMDGYFKEPEATAAVLQNGWLHTGDMAVWNEESFIDIVDRKKDIIISGGENISSIEVEKAIFSHPKVLECAVVSAPDAKWGEIPVAIVVLKASETMTSQHLLAHLEGRLAKFKHPRRIQFEDKPLPKTGTGKILKRELREQFWQGKERRVQGV